MYKLIVKFCLITMLLFCSSFVNADDAKSPWNPSSALGVNVSQVSFSNWAQGGDNSISWTFLSNLGLEYKGQSWNYTNKLKTVYGRSKIGSDNYRTNENELYLENVVTHLLGWPVNPFISNTVRTTLTTGFDYKSGKAVEIADFFDPGYVSQSLGFTYKFEKMFSTRLGIAMQEIFTNKYRNYSDDPKTKNEVEAFKMETGMESVTDSELKLDDNLVYATKLRLFTRFDKLEVWDVRWDNIMTAKVTKYLNVNFSVLVLYEKNLSPKTQMKQALQMGVIYSLF